MIEIYVLEGCPYCNNALSLLKNSNKKYKMIVGSSSKKDYYKKRHNMETFPQILIKSKKMYVTLGGNSDLMKAFEILDIHSTSNISNEALYLFLEEK